MSVKALRWVRTVMPRNSQGGPDPLAKSTLMLLAIMHNEDDDIDLFPGQQYISEQTGLSVSTVNNRLQSLEMQGYLTRIPRYQTSGPRRGQRTTDQYILHLERPADDLIQRNRLPANLSKRDSNQQSTGIAQNGLRYENFGSDPQFPAERAHRDVSSWTPSDLADEAIDLLNWIGYPKTLKAKVLVPVIHDLEHRYGRYPSEHRSALRRVFLDQEQVEAFLREGRTAKQALLEVLIDVVVRERVITPLPADPDNPFTARYTSIDGSTHISDADCRDHDRRLERGRYGI